MSQLTENLNHTKSYSLSRKLEYDYQEQFYQVMTRLRGSRAASSIEIQEARISEVVDGAIISRPAKRVQNLEAKTKANGEEKEPEIIDLQEYARSGRAASVQGINKTKVIADFLSSNGSRY